MEEGDSWAEAPRVSGGTISPTAAPLRALESAHSRAKSTVPGRASYLAQASVGLAGQAADAPASDHALCPTTLGDCDGVDHLVRLEDGVHSHRLLEQLVGEVHLVLDAATVDLHK